MSIITSNTFSKGLKPGLYKFTQMFYENAPSVWKEIFAVKQGNYKYEEGVAGNNFTLVTPYSEGGKVPYYSQSQGPVTRIDQVAYSAGFIVTREEEQDMVDKAKELIMKRADSMMMSFARTKETVHANEFNGGFINSGKYGDGVALLSTAHPTRAGNQSNKLTIDADISEAALEQLTIQIRKATDNVGNRIGLSAKTLYVPAELFYEANRILDSELQNDSANNAINVLKSKGVFSKVISSQYLTDPDAYFILTDIPEGDGFVHFNRTSPEMRIESLQEGWAELYKVYERYTQTCFDWRAVYGSAGA